MINLEELNRVNFSQEETNLQKMKIIWEKITQDPKIDFDANFWQSIIEKNNGVKKEIKELIMDFLVSNANNEFYGRNILEHFFQRKTKLKDISKKYQKISLETDSILTAVIDDDFFLFKKIIIESPVFFDKIIKKSLSQRGGRYLFQYGNNKNIFVGEGNSAKAIFRTISGHVFKFIYNHQGFVDRVTDNLAIYEARKLSTT